jgi:hypothetical protein
MINCSERKANFFLKFFFHIPINRPLTASRMMLILKGFDGRYGIDEETINIMNTIIAALSKTVTAPVIIPAMAMPLPPPVPSRHFFRATAPKITARIPATHPNAPSMGNPPTPQTSDVMANPLDGPGGT